MSLIQVGKLKYRDDSWETVYVEIIDKELIVRKKAKSSKIMFKIDLSKASSVLKNDDSPSLFSFIIEGEKKNYYFNCLNNEVLEDWINCIKKVIFSTPISNDNDKNNNKSNEKNLKLIDQKKEEDLVLGDFEILKVIGRGHYGKVQLVKGKKDGKFYAMKSMSKNELKSEKCISSILEEKKILTTFSHPFLVSAKYALQTPTKILFLTEYIPGGELSKRIHADIHFPIERIRLYGAMLVSAIGYLHENQIIHRDIKPGNILIDTDGYLKLTDFGLVKSGIMCNSCTGTFCGTPEYIAPEIISGESYSKSVDWWSLGVILYEMFYGVPPFINFNIEKLYQSIMNDDVLFPETMDIDPGLKDLIEKLLDKFPDQRIGAGFLDAASIEDHPFFESIDFDKLQNKEYEMDWKPEIKNSSDVSNFDPQYTDLKTGLTPESLTITKSVQDMFKNFSFYNNK